ncbi:MAG: MMPL family transporter [Salinisphaeraceae bacterium]|nr:MMPL family transporter [Salinisphaeraceae bacterium]
MYPFLAKLNSFSIRHAWLVSFVWIVVVAGFSSFMGSIKVDGSYRSFFDKADPLVIALDEIESRYDTGDSLIFLVKTRQGDLFTQEGLGAIEILTEKAWQLPKSLRVDSLRNFPFSRSSGDELTVSEFYVDASALADADLARIKQDVLGEKLLVDRLVTADGHASLVVVNFTEEVGHSLALSREVYHTALKLRDEMRERYPNLGFYVSGIVGGSAAGADAAMADGSLLIPLGLTFALLAIVGFLYYESRHVLTSVYGMLACLAVIIVSSLVPMGVMGMFRIAANNITILIPVIILTLAVADSLHVLLTYYQRMNAGLDNISALKESLRINAEAVWLTSVTTMLGFLVMNASDSPPFRTMGNLVALGVFMAWLSVNTLLPAIMSMLPVKVELREGQDARPIVGLADRVIRHYKIILAAGFLTVLLGVVCVPMNRMNDSWTTYLTEDTTFGSDTAELINSFEDFNYIEFELDTGKENGIFDLAFLYKVSEFAEWLRTKPEVSYVQSMDLTLKRLNRNMHGDDPEWERMPETADLAAQYLLLYELSLPYGASLTDAMTMDKSAFRLTVGLNHSETAEHLRFQKEAAQWLEENAPELAYPGTSTTTIMAALSRRDSIAMLTGTVMALIVISLTIMAVFRSLKYGLLSFLVNVMPATLALGLWGLFVGQVGISVSMVFAASLGIIVDYCLHFLSKYRRAKQEQSLSEEDAIRYAFSTVGVALLVTTAVLVINFAILGLSNFRINIDMGVLTAMTIVFALLAQLFFLPSLLLGMARLRKNA